MTEEIDTRLTRIESGLSRVEVSVAKLADAMVQIARLEVSLNHNGEAVARAFQAVDRLSARLDKHQDEADERIKRLEEVQPVQKLISGWVLAWIAGIVGLLGGALASRVLGL